MTLIVVHMYIFWNLWACWNYWDLQPCENQFRFVFLCGICLALFMWLFLLAFLWIINFDNRFITYYTKSINSITIIIIGKI